MSGRRITTSEATIKTATVEIKTITVSGKQMTLAVFRQLQQEDLIDPKTLQLRGVPWGRVNYHPGCGAGEHVHVIWQHGEELRQSAVYRSLPEPIEADLRRRYELAYTHWCYVQAREDRVPAWYEEQARGPWSGSVPCKLADELWVNVDIPEDVQAIWNAHHYYGVSGKLYSESPRHREALADLHAFCATLEIETLSIDEAATRVQAIMADASDLLRRYRTHYRTIQALDQLFIAV